MLRQIKVLPGTYKASRTFFLDQRLTLSDIRMLGCTHQVVEVSRGKHVAAA